MTAPRRASWMGCTPRSAKAAIRPTRCARRSWPWCAAVTSTRGRPTGRRSSSTERREGLAQRGVADRHVDVALQEREIALGEGSVGARTEELLDARDDRIDLRRLEVGAR